MAAVEDDYRRADLSDRDRTMLDFVVELTREPSLVGAAWIDRLRAAGFDDPQIHDIVQVTGLFAYFTRLAEGLGADPEPDWQVTGIAPGSAEKEP